MFRVSVVRTVIMRVFFARLLSDKQSTAFVWNMEEGKSFSGSSDTNHDNSYIVKTLRLNCQFSLKARIYLWMIDCSVMLKIFLAWLVYTKYSYMHERKNCKITSNRCYFTYTYMYIYICIYNQNWYHGSSHIYGFVGSF